MYSYDVRRGYSTGGTERTGRAHDVMYVHVRVRVRVRTGMCRGSIFRKIEGMCVCVRVRVRACVYIYICIILCTCTMYLVQGTYT